MNFAVGLIGIFVFLITLTVVMPVTGELLPIMIGDMGASVGIMVSMSILVLIAGAIFIFINTVMGRDQHANFQ